MFRKLNVSSGWECHPFPMDFLAFGLSCINVPRLWCPSEITKDWRQQRRGVLSPFIKEIFLYVLSVSPSKSCAWIPKLDPLQLHLCFPSVPPCPGEAAFSRAAGTEGGGVPSSNPPPKCLFHSVLSLLYAPWENKPCCSLGCPQTKLSLGAGPSSGCPGCPFWYLLCRSCHLCSLTHPLSCSSPKIPLGI